MRLEVTSNESKQLERARKWAQLVVDSKIIMSDKNQNQVDQDRIYDIQKELERIKSLDDIVSIKNLRKEFEKIDIFHESLDKCSNYDETSQKLLSVDVEMIKTLIEKAQQDILINIQDEINGIKDQINLNSEWEANCQKILEDVNFDDWSKIDLSRKMLDQAENDPDSTFTLIDRSLIRKLRIWYIKAKYNDQKRNKRDIIDFILALEREINKLSDNQTEIQIQLELKMIELAKRLKQIIAFKIQVGNNDENKPNQPRTLTIQDIEYALENKDNLPFQLEKKQIENLNKQKDRYYQELDIEALALLKELSFVTPHEKFIEKMKKNYAFIMERVAKYPDLEILKKKAEDQKQISEDQDMKDESNNQEEADLNEQNITEKKKVNSQEGSESIEVEEEEIPPRFLQDFQKVHKKFFKLKCQCPEAIRLVQEYEKARGEFDDIKSKFLAQKISGKFTFQQLQDFNERLINVTLDFEDEELQFRQDIWHARVAKVLHDLQNDIFIERLSTEQIKYWLEEGQELEVVNDIKYEKLNEVVEDIDHIMRALKMCATVEEVDKIDEQENRKLIEMNHLIKKARQKMLKGEVPKHIRKSIENRKSLGSCALEYLKNSRTKISKEQLEDVDMDNKMIQEEGGGDEEEDEDDMDTEELEDEKKEAKSDPNKIKKAPKKKQSIPIKTEVKADKFQKATSTLLTKKKPVATTKENKEPKKRVVKANQKAEKKEKLKIEKKVKASGEKLKSPLKKKLEVNKKAKNKVELDKKDNGDNDDSKEESQIENAKMKELKAKVSKMQKKDVPSKPTNSLQPLQKKIKEKSQSNSVETTAPQAGLNSLKSKLGGLKSPSKGNSLLTKKKIEKPIPKVEINNAEDEPDQKMDIDSKEKEEENDQPNNEDDKPKEKKQMIVDKTQDEQDDTADGSEDNKSSKEEANKKIENKKSLPLIKTNTLLGKRPIQKTDILANDKKDEVQKDKPAIGKAKIEPAVESKAAAPTIAKKVGIIKKPGGGLAASLAKINK
ncbi:UNKNOWN [Stylonychia lemnae]|uniref:Uncharacterized protein n=1 Tax=Stylonychia lemnae TaxID=5949 RepID=A0A078A3S7_STYLE|nr:UNKNOWN [Stylonychia lemnae]|eukprot:CDW76908.1 UNKNOWN [Stylonychia lemnae]